MGYEDERYGDRGILRGEVDYDQFDELAGLDVDYLQEIGAVLAPATTAPTTTTRPRLLTSRIAYSAPSTLAPAPTSPTTSRCPSGEEYDKIEQMCRPVQTSTGTTLTTLRARLQTAAPSTAQVLAPVKPRDAPVSASAHPPPDAVRAADVLLKPPPSPGLPSYSDPWKGSGGRRGSGSPGMAPPSATAPITLLEMPDAPPPSATGGKVVGLSTGAKIGIGLGAGALLLYIMTRK
jgi:hypothetical protein